MTQKSAVIICFAAEAWNHALIILCSLQIAFLQVSTPSSVIWGWYRRFGFGDKMNISNEWDLVLLLSTNFKFFKQIIENLTNDCNVYNVHHFCQTPPLFVPAAGAKKLNYVTAPRSTRLSSFITKKADILHMLGSADHIRGRKIPGL